MVEEFGSIAAGGILALLLIREVFAFLRERNGNGGGGQRKRPLTGPHVTSGQISTVVDKLDRCLAQHADLSDTIRDARRKIEVIEETADRLERRLESVDTAIMKLGRRPTGPVDLPGVIDP